MEDPQDRAADGGEGDQGMVDLETYEQLQAAAGPSPAEDDPDALPRVSDERLRELKRQAREQIEGRLRARRKQRRLMRGGDPA